MTKVFSLITVREIITRGKKMKRQEAEILALEKEIDTQRQDF